MTPSTNPSLRPVRAARGGRDATRPVRVLIVDDHPTLCLGFARALERAPDLECVGAAESGYELWPLLYRTEPNLVVVDYLLGGEDGLVLSRRIADRAPHSRIVLFTAGAVEQLAVPARLARVDAIVDKNRPLSELLEAIREVARGDALPPEPTRAELTRANRLLRDEDLSILGMALHGTSAAEIAATLRTEPADIARRAERMIAALGYAGEDESVRMGRGVPGADTPA
jgi:DNA-binding NarL/FixJ family response regulator